MGSEEEIPALTTCPQHLLDEHPPYIKEQGVIYCESSYDKVACWPITRGGTVATIACPGYVPYLDVTLNSEESATKYCHANGSWADYANYTLCLTPHEEEISKDDWAIHVIFLTGYSISTVALIVALFIFFLFRSLRCLRNTIHCHLMATFTLRNILWFILRYSLESDPTNQYGDHIVWSMRLAVAVAVYLLCTTFFWMLVEGIYLHTMIVWAFSADRVKMWKYALLGWGGPLLVVVPWAIMKATLEKDDEMMWLPTNNSACDWIYVTPILILLAINIFFLTSIEYVLITKLKASNSLATSQYKKAVKGTVILFPLLGIIYIVMISPSGSDSIGHIIFNYFNTILQSVQGLLVAVFYCFLNAEVRYTIKSKIKRWKDKRNIQNNYSRNSRGASVVQKGTTECTSVLLKNTNSNQYNNKDKETGENENGKDKHNRHRLSSGVSETTYIGLESHVNKSPEGKLKNDSHAHQTLDCCVEVLPEPSDEECDDKTCENNE